MISRSEIIRGRQVRGQQVGDVGRSASQINGGGKQDKVHHQLAASSKLQHANSNADRSSSRYNSQAMNDGSASSEGYACYASASAANDPYASATNGPPTLGPPVAGSRQQATGARPAQYGRHFDPYSIYSEEEDVWSSEERLFEVSFRIGVDCLCALIRARAANLERDN